MVLTVLFAVRFYELLVLEWRSLFIALKEFDKIAYIVKPARERDIRNGIIGMRKLEAGHLNTIAIEIINRRVMCDFLEEAAEIVRG